MANVLAASWHQLSYDPNVITSSGTKIMPEDFSISVSETGIPVWRARAKDVSDWVEVIINHVSVTENDSIGTPLYNLYFKIQTLNLIK